jgi:hypothetical protein
MKEKLKKINKEKEGRKKEKLMFNIKWTKEFCTV